MFQDSVELFLVLVAERLNVFKKGMQFLDYFAAINSAIQPDALAERGAMVRLNDARVSLKHYSNPPPRSAVEKFRDSTRAFFDVNTSKLFAFPFDDISLAYLVTDRAARDALEGANRHRAAGDLGKAAEGLAAALAYLFKAFGIQVQADHPLPFNFGGEDGNQISRALNDHEKELARLQVDVALLRHGIDLRPLRAFQLLTPTVSLPPVGGPRYVSFAGAPLPTDERMRFCYNFVIETALELQAEQIDLDAVLQGTHARFRI
jgi:hypothetical protein